MSDTATLNPDDRLADLADALVEDRPALPAAPDQGAVLRIGTITDVGAGVQDGTVKVDAFAGLDARYDVSAMTPSVGDRVWALQQGPVVVVGGQLNNYGGRLAYVGPAGEVGLALGTGTTLYREAAGGHWRFASVGELHSQQSVTADHQEAASHVRIGQAGIRAGYPEDTSWLRQGAAWWRTESKVESSQQFVADYNDNARRVGIGGVGPLSASAIQFGDPTENGYIWFSNDVLSTDVDWNVSGTVTGANGDAGEVRIGRVGPLTASGIVFRDGGSVIYSSSDGSISTDAITSSSNVTAEGSMAAENGNTKEVAIGAVGPLTASAVSLLNGQSFIWSSIAGRLSMDIIEPEAVWSHGVVEAESGEAGEVAIGNVGPLTASGITFRNGGSVIWAPTNGKVQTEDLQCADLIVDGVLSGDGATFSGGVLAGSFVSSTFDTGSGHDFTINGQGQDPHLNNWTPDTESSAYAGIGDFNVYAAVVDLNQLRAAYENLRLHVIELTKFANAQAAHLATIGLFQ